MKPLFVVNIGDLIGLAIAGIIDMLFLICWIADKFKKK